MAFGGTGKSKFEAKYRCVTESCPCVRKVFPVEDKFVVFEYGEHKHSDKPQGIRHFMAPQEKELADNLCKLGLPPSKLRIGMSNFNHPMSESTSKHYVTKFNRPRKEEDIVEWITNKASFECLMILPATAQISLSIHPVIMYSHDYSR